MRLGPFRYAALPLALSFALLPAALIAQESASVSGSILDESGGGLPGVSIVMDNLKGGPQGTAVSDQAGKFTIGGLAPGAYRLSASLSGFAAASAELTLAAAQVVTKDITLKVASYFENVTVTAEKREEQILDVPASISALTGGSLEAQGVTSLKDVAATIPSLSIVETGPGTQRTQIRGISSPQNLPTVGLYLDEMPVNSEGAGSGLDVRLLDLDRVEVLRGPQGTLYGEGAMGGTIKYVTRNPQLDTLGFQFAGAYGSVADGSDAYRASAVANIPVVKGKFALRVLAGQERSPGWVDYPARNVRDGNEGDSTTFRVKGLWAANDSFTASLMFQAQDSEYDDQSFSDPDGTAPFVLPQPLHERSKAANLVLNYDAGGFTVLSSTAYLNRKNDGSFDFTALFAPIFDLFGFPPGTVKTVALGFGGESDQFSQEVRLASKGSRRLNWTLGAYYRHRDGEGFNQSTTTPNPLPFEVFVTKNENTTRQSAVFGELEFAPTGRFAATVGLRYFHDKRTQSSSVGSFGPPADNPDQSGSFDSVNPRFVLSFRPGDGTLVYASAAKGFRSGGFNLVPPGCAIPKNFEPESLWTYEVGSSASLASGRFVVQGAVYRNDWKDIQTLNLCPGTFISLTDNVGKASGSGVDLQLTITPLRELRFTLSGNWNDSHYDDDSLSHKNGDEIDYAAEYNFGIAADWNFRWGSGRRPGVLHLDYQVTGPFHLNFRNFGVDALRSDVIEGLNARFALTFGKVELSVHGQNLLDEYDAVQPAIPFGGVPSAVRPQPRTIGAGVGFQF